MIVKIIDSKPINFKTPENKTIEGFKNLFINDYAGKFEIRSVFCKEDLFGYSVEVKYSKRFDKFSVVYEKETEETENKNETDEDLPF